jgi:hypothetical protein
MNSVIMFQSNCIFSVVILSLFHLVSDLLHDLRQAVLNVCEENLCQLRCQVADTQQVLRHRRVHRMRVEIELFLLDGSLHRYPVDDILLGPILDANESKSQLDILSLDHAFGIGSSVHDIDLGDDTDGSDTLGVQLSGHLEAV